MGEQRWATLTEAAERAVAAFTGGANGHLDGLSTVHVVAQQAWRGLHVPGPLCHVGSAGWDFERFRPTRDPVTCRRCLTARPDANRTAEGGQLALELPATQRGGLPAEGEPYHPYGGH